jgi:hypothetical protein
MILPFGLGFGIAYGIYHQFHEGVADHPISFGVFGLFVGTALSITAFPVLCRILSELNLLRSSVGVTVLAAGIGNDVTGWILLALCVALVNNSNGLSALWALLCCIGWTLMLIFVVRPPFIWVLRRTGSLQNGPTQGMVALTMLMVLASAWFTGRSILSIQALTQSDTDFPRHHRCSSHLWGLPSRADLPARRGFRHQTDRKDRRSYWRLVLASILCSLWPEHKLGSVEGRHYVGIRNWHHRMCLCWQDLGRNPRRPGKQAVMARKLRHRLPDELQGSSRIDRLGKLRQLLELDVPLTTLEHRPSSRYPVGNDLQHVYCHGLGYYSRNNPSYQGLVPALVPKEG